MDNYEAFGRFFILCQEKGLEVRVDRGDVRVGMAFRTSKVMFGGEALVRLSVHSGDRTQVQVLDSDSFTMHQVPFDYNADFGDWSYATDVLTIRGSHPVHGTYVTTFRFVRLP